MANTMTPNCPNCKDFADQPRASGRVTLFRMDGVTHAVPSIWLAGRTLTCHEPIEDALSSWARHCSVDLTREATR